LVNRLAGVQPVRALFGELSGTMGLVAALLYGTGGSLLHAV
jgi:hypothetical protein